MRFWVQPREGDCLVAKLRPGNVHQRLRARRSEHALRRYRSLSEAPPD